MWLDHPWRSWHVCIPLLLSAPALAGEAPLTLQGSAVYYGLRVPLAVQSQTAKPDLSDVQVLNARGEPVPYAWVAESGTPEVEEKQQRVPFFKAPAAASAADATRRGGWIIDTRHVKGALLALQLSVPASTHGIYSFALESSPDLQQWHSVQPEAQLLSLQHQGLRLENSRFDLGGLRTRYLRLRPLEGHQPPPLTAASVSSVTHFTPAPPMQWSEPLAPTQCTPQHCDYTLPRHLPLEQLEWRLADANTLAPVALLAQYERGESSGSARPAWRHRHPVREHLQGLHRKTAPAPTEVAPTWYPLAQTTVYWLRLPQGEVRAAPLQLAGHLVTQLRVQPVGGMVQLGAKPPTLRVGSRAASLVFLAREPAPFRLSWGGAQATAVLPLSQLMPTRRANDPLPSDTAQVVMSAPAAVAAAAPQASAPAPAPVPSRKLWLWGVLLAALGLMGFMAWSLLRPKAAA